MFIKSKPYMNQIHIDNTSCSIYMWQCRDNVYCDSHTRLQVWVLGTCYLVLVVCMYLPKQQHI